MADADEQGLAASEQYPDECAHMCQSWTMALVATINKGKGKGKTKGKGRRKGKGVPCT